MQFQVSRHQYHGKKRMKRTWKVIFLSSIPELLINLNCYTIVSITPTVLWAKINLSNVPCVRRHFVSIRCDVICVNILMRKYSNAIFAICNIRDGIISKIMSKNLIRMIQSSSRRNVGMHLKPHNSRTNAIIVTKYIKASKCSFYTKTFVSFLKAYFN